MQSMDPIYLCLLSVTVYNIYIHDTLHHTDNIQTCHCDGQQQVQWNLYILGLDLEHQRQLEQPESEQHEKMEDQSLNYYGCLQFYIQFIGFFVKEYLCEHFCRINETCYLLAMMRGV